MKILNIYLNSMVTSILFLCIIVSMLLVDVIPAYAEPSRIKRNLPENMVLIKGGCFQMGDIFRDLPSSEKPVHEVCVADFYIGKYEVTIGEFRQFVRETGYKTEAEQQDGCHSWTGDGILKKIKGNYWGNTGFAQTDKDPVVCVSWNDVYHYIQWLNEKEGRNYRLLTEAEWEYAARSGGKDYQYSWGNAEPAGNVADESLKETIPGMETWEGYRDGFAFTAPAGSFIPNELGIYDMSGNAYEWVLDWHEKDYYSHSPKHNPSGPDKGSSKLLRGGAWDLLPDTARTTSRYWNESRGRAVCIGFRLAHPAR